MVGGSGPVPAGAGRAERGAGVVPMRKFLGAGVAVLVAAATWTLGGGVTQAAQPGPQQSGLLQPRAQGCPVGIELAKAGDPADPAEQVGMSLFVAPPDPASASDRCAPGLFVTVNPGPVQVPGSAFGLPLNAADCAAGSAALGGFLTELGGTPGPAPGGPPGTAPDAAPAGACPSGEALIGQIRTIIGALTPAPSTCPSGVVAAASLGRADLTSVRLGGGAAGCPPGTLLAVVQGPSGTPNGWAWVNPGPVQRIEPSGVPGQSIVRPATRG